MTKKIEVRGPGGNVIGLVTEFKPSVHHPGGTDVTAAIMPQFKDYLVGRIESFSMGAKVEEPFCSLCDTAGEHDCPNVREVTRVYELSGRDYHIPESSKGVAGQITFISASIDMIPEAFGAPEGTEGYLDGKPAAFEKVTHLKIERRVRDGSITSCGKTIYNRKRGLDKAVGLDDLEHVTCPDCLARQRKEKP